MFAAGASHPMRQPCRELIDAVVDGRLDAAVSLEVVQEILHRFSGSGRRDVGAAMAKAILDLFAPVLPITERMMRRMPALFAEYEDLSARDLVHVATCMEVRIDVIVSQTEDSTRSRVFAVSTQATPRPCSSSPNPSPEVSY
ncbi:MAG: PIN domain-containing protein [Acidimicrobiia bacterium]|nr:PIN domain-containing protein [Acidimicrobiia bacterium]